MVASLLLKPAEAQLVSTFEEIEYEGIKVQYTPQMQGADKVLFWFHGTGGDSSKITSKQEYLDLAEAAMAEGFYAVVPESSNRIAKQWDSSTVIVEDNQDLTNLNGLIDLLLKHQQIQVTSKFFALGHSNGGGFASIASYALDFEAASINCASGITQAIEAPDFKVPIIFTNGEFDKARPDQFTNQQTLLNKGVRSEVYINYGFAHPFSAQHTPAILSFFLGLEQEQSRAKYVYALQGPEEKDEIDGVTIDADGFTYVSGDLIRTVNFNGVERTSKGWRDIFIAKLDNQGNEVAFWTYGGKGDEVMYDITSDNLGNLIVNGAFGDGSDFPNGDVSSKTLTLKIDSHSGKVIWRKSYGVGGGNERWAYLAKINPEGDVLWQFNTTSVHRERIRAVATGFQDSRVIVGYEFWNGIEFKGQNLYEVEKLSLQSRGAYVILDSDGNMIHHTIVESPSMSNVRATGGFDQGLFVHGHFRSEIELGNKTLKSVGQSDSFVARIGKNGQIRWSKTLGDSAAEGGGELAVSDKGDLFLTDNHGAADYSIFNSKGELEEKVFGNTLYSQGYVIQLSKQGELKWAESLNQKVGSSATGVIEVRGDQLILNVRLSGDIDVNGRYLSPSQFGGKDAVAISYVIQ